MRSDGSGGRRSRCSDMAVVRGEGSCEGMGMNGRDEAGTREVADGAR